MRSELLTAVICLVTTVIRTGRYSFITFPQFVLVVFAVLVSLPVVLAAELLIAGGKSTSVWLHMPFLMLPDAWVSRLSHMMVFKYILKLATSGEGLSTFILVADKVVLVRVIASRTSDSGFRVN